MSKLFGNLSTEGHEENEDRLGGGFQPLSTDIYEATIKAAYAGQADSGAQNVTIIADVNGHEFRETIYVTNKKGENFFHPKDKEGKPITDKQVTLPGYTMVDDICLITTGLPLSEQEAEDKVVNVYDREAGREIPKTVPMLTAMIGKSLSLAIVEILENKSKKVNGKYEDTAETRTINTIEKAFDTESKMTVVEAQNEAEEAVFYDAWLSKNQGNVRDKRSIKDGEAGKSGRPGGSAPQAGNNNAPKSLFGNKKAA